MVSAIMKRRSIRKFTEEKVSADSVMRIVEAGAAAPSAMNRRPVRFILLDKEAMARFAEKVAQKEPFLEGQWAIAVCADRRGYDQEGAWLEDCSAAMENILIAATEMGLGSLWYGVYARAAKEPPVREFLKLPDEVEACGIAVIGHAAEEKEPHWGVDSSILHIGCWKE